jgi:hypothetical protein
MARAKIPRRHLVRPNLTGSYCIRNALLWLRLVWRRLFLCEFAQAATAILASHLGRKKISGAGEAMVSLIKIASTKPR